jgi:hypothetical protein
VRITKDTKYEFTKGIDDTIGGDDGGFLVTCFARLVLRVIVAFMNKTSLGWADNQRFREVQI